MTATIAHFLTGLTIVAAGGLVAVGLVMLLPAQRRSIWAALAILAGTVGSVAFGTEIATTLPDRIIATHGAAATLDAVKANVPELQQLAEADPLIEYELRSAFQSAYMATPGSPAVRAERAGHALGLAVQRVHMRGLTELSDASARRLIGIERQIVEEIAWFDPAQCSGMAANLQDQKGSVRTPRLLALRRAELRAKLFALIDSQPDLPTLDLAERQAVEGSLREQASRTGGSTSQCGQLQDFYAVLEQQPLPVQGKWVRSRRMFAVTG